MSLAKKQAGVKKTMKEYRTLRDEIVVYLRENLGLTFGEIAMEFGTSKQRAYQMYKEAKKG